MKESTLILTFWLLLVCPFQIFSQESIANNLEQLYFKSYTSADGLPSQNTHNTFQDKYGFLWISTDEGLTRYDGYQFRPYYDDVKRGIKLKGACGFYEDDQDKLWVINGSGYLHLYDRENNSFISMDNPLENGWMEPDAHGITADAEGSLWFSSYGGLVHYDPIKKDTIRTIRVEAIRAPNQWPHKEKVRFGPIYFQEGKAIWAGTRKFGFVKIDLNTDSTHFYRFDLKYDRALLDDWITDIVELDEHTLLLADQPNGLVIWDLENEEVKELIRINEILDLDRNVSITDIHKVDHNRIWLATEESGLLLFNISSRQIEHRYVPDTNTSQSIGGNKISHVTQDREGTLWIGSNTLHQGSSSLYDFSDLVHDKEDPFSLIDDKIYWMSKLNTEDIIVSTSTGLGILDVDKNTFTYPSFLTKQDGRTYGVSNANENNEAWVGTYNNLIKVDLDNSEILKKYDREIVVDEQKNILRRACRAMEDSQSNLWAIDHWGRLKYVLPKVDKVTNVYDLAQDKETGRFVNCMAILDDPKQKQIIVGMDYGLALVSYEDKQVTRLSLSYAGVDLSKAQYSYLYRDLQERVWVIIDGKTYILDLSNQSLDLLDLNEQYGVGSFRWVVEEPKHSFWFSSFKGIIRYDEIEERSSLYYTPNVGGASFSSPSPVVQTKGKIYFSGYKGITILDPEIVVPDIRSAQVTITELKVNQEPHKSDGSIYSRDTLKLKYMLNDIDISLSNFSFVNQNDCKYRYRLAPRDIEWIDNGNDHTIAFYNLPPDNYTLEIDASNSDGIWSNRVTHLSIIITPPWWKTFWARGLFFIIGLGAMWSVQYFTYQNKLEKQAQLSSLRSKISSDLHDDVGTVLTGIAMQSELLENFADGKTKKVAGEIAKRTRLAMGTLRDTVWAMDARKDSIGDHEDRMLDFVEDTLRPKEILTLFESTLGKELRLKPNVRQALYLIFKESIVNIAKHSDADKVDINLDSYRGFIHLSIKDNGSHVENMKTSGMGIRNMTDRASNLNGSYIFKYENGYSTVVNIPL